MEETWWKKLDYKIDRILDKMFSGHMTIGNVTFFGRNAMHWAVNISTKKYGYICFCLPIPMYGKIYKYFYVSPNGTPWASTIYYGPDRGEKKLAKFRKEAFGHGFDTEKFSDELHELNNKGGIPKNLMREKIIDELLD